MTTSGTLGAFDSRHRTWKTPRPVEIRCQVAVGQNQWYHFGVGAPPILEPVLVGIGMFTGVLDFDPWPGQGPVDRPARQGGGLDPPAPVRGQERGVQPAARGRSGLGAMASAGIWEVKFGHSLCR